VSATERWFPALVTCPECGHQGAPDHGGRGMKLGDTATCTQCSAVQQLVPDGLLMIGWRAAGEVVAQ
jgi:hypothetical protein